MLCLCDGSLGYRALDCWWSGHGSPLHASLLGTGSLQVHLQASSHHPYLLINSWPRAKRFLLASVTGPGSEAIWIQDKGFRFGTWAPSPPKTQTFLQAICVLSDDCRSGPVGHWRREQLPFHTESPSLVCTTLTRWQKNTRGSFLSAYGNFH